MKPAANNKTTFLIGGIGLVLGVLLILYIVLLVTQSESPTTTESAEAVGGAIPTQQIVPNPRTAPGSPTTNQAPTVTSQPGSAPVTNPAPTGTSQPGSATTNQAPTVTSQPGSAPVTNPAPTTPGRRTELVIDGNSSGLSAADLDLNLDLYAPAKSTYVPPADVFADVSLPVSMAAGAGTNSSAPASAPTPATVLPSMAGLDFAECGTLTIPTGLDLAVFAVTAPRDAVVECLGEAVAEPSCGPSKATIADAGYATNIYVAERPEDGVCAAGMPVSTTEVALCSVEELMNRGTGKSRTMAQWRTNFQSDPGGTFADMYFDNQQLFATGGSMADDYDCVLYSI